MNTETMTSPQTIIAALYVFALAAFLGNKSFRAWPPRFSWQDSESSRPSGAQC